MTRTHQYRQYQPAMSFKPSGRTFRCAPTRMMAYIPIFNHKRSPMRASWAEFHPKRRQCYIVMRWECVSDKEMHRVHKRWCFVPEKANVPCRLRIDEGLFSIDWSSCHENSPYQELILTLLSSFFATIVLQVKGLLVGRSMTDDAIDEKKRVTT
jgi:hypothetical protein